MNPTTALLSIGINYRLEPEPEQIENAIEEAVFAEASFFLRRTFIPKLAEARIRKLTKITEVAAAIGSPFTNVNSNPEFIHESELVGTGNFLNLLSSYNRFETKLKLALTRSINPYELILLYRLWIKFFTIFRDTYIQLYESLPLCEPTPKQESIAVTKPADFNLLIEDLKNGQYDTTVYLEYLRLLKLCN